MIHVCKEGKSGSKSITDEYVTESGIKRTAKRQKIYRLKILNDKNLESIYEGWNKYSVEKIKQN